ncbi:glycosyl hydrolase-related protein [Streptomyces sp. NPDC005925]|uniref:glycoside hydrolase family 38 N-terminal domain-containing protein n=1 Tax=Streptomyces sp. NPDC005925 TaxID=3157172 RepID=UPI0033C3D5C4
MTSAAPSSAASAPAGATPTCHVVTHVHWDREWYRPFEAFRARLVEMAERICDDIDSDRLASFHLDGQTIVLADIAALRPDLADRLRAHAAAGRLTVGPWHVLADNQLVSGESLIRNLLTARRWAGTGTLSGIGYSPDAFGHPADLPRVLAGFGMDTALVWRGAPPAHARFRWRSPDGAEVFAVNQAYHAAEVLWPVPEDGTDDSTRLTGFLDGERERLPDGPWLLMNGGDHLYPADARARIAAATGPAAAAGTELRESTLKEFFAAARRAAAHSPEALPVVQGELRHPGGRLTFLLPGTLSARTYLKHANARAQTLIERWVEPLLALHAPADATAAAELRHAWELLLRNAPHDSICGCSVDEVHRENEVRFDRVGETGEHALARALGASGLDVRLYGDRPETDTHLAVLNAHGSPHTGPVVAELLTAPCRFPVEVLDAHGRSVPFETEVLGDDSGFEADLDLLPDSRPSLRHRLALLAHDVPPLGRVVFRVRLGEAPSAQAVPRPEDGRANLTTGQGLSVTAAADASVTVRLPDGTELPGVGRLVDGGDRGDTYTYDPPTEDALVSPVLRSVRRVTSPARSSLVMDARLKLPASLTEDRSARSEHTVDVPVRIEVTSWHGDPTGALRWAVSFDNMAQDHRLRMHFPSAAATGYWTGDGHFSLLERPVSPDLGPLPDLPGHEAVCGSAPVQSVGAVGAGLHRLAVAAPGLPEMRGLCTPETGTDELVITLMRAVGWLSRFDLTSRTTGAGPMLATPQAQCPGKLRFTLAAAFGGAVADDLDLAAFAAVERVPLRAWQARPGTVPASGSGGFQAEGALLTALKVAEDGDGLILRVSNPTAQERPASLRLPAGCSIQACRLDESPTGERRDLPATGHVDWTMAPYELTTLRVCRTADMC